MGFQGGRPRCAQVRYIGERFQVERQIPGGMEPLLRLLLETAEDHALHVDVKARTKDGPRFSSAYLAIMKVSTTIP